MAIKNFILTSALATSLALGGCATAGGGKTAVEAAMQNCAISVVGGGLMGAIIGNQLGDGRGNAKKGALIGAAVGAGVCGFLLKEASDRDKERIRELQIAALNKEDYGLSSGEFIADNGKRITVQTITSEAPLTDKPLPNSAIQSSRPASTDIQTVATAETTGVTWTNCRNSQSSMAVDGGGMKKLGQTYECRTSLGDWFVI